MQLKNLLKGKQPAIRRERESRRDDGPVRAGRP